jgi:2,3-diketo-5-methylthio-1-phosphopentane phosphatase
MIIFSDFDGTIAQNDVGDLLFQNFGDWPECEKMIQQWIRGDLSSYELLQREAATARLTREQLDALCDAQSLTPGFPDFVAFCRRQNWPVIVLSDGLDYYIQRILLRHGIELPVYSNRLEFLPPDGIAVSFPYLTQSCGKCGNCKGYHVRRLAKPGEKIIYIGDGYSDRCGAQEADFVFAKRDLAKWCEENQIEYWRFESFEHVLNQFKIGRIENG